MSLSVHEASYDLMLERLRGALLAAVAWERGALGTIQYRASVALYVLLDDHSIDRRGRCRSCRGQATLVGRRRRFCRVYLSARFYLYQADDVLLRCLTDELDVDVREPCDATASHDSVDTDVLPRAGVSPNDPHIERPATSSFRAMELAGT